MNTTTKQLILRKDDYETILSYLKGGNKKSFDNANAEELQAELNKAMLVDKDAFPARLVRLNSRVKVKELTNDKLMELTLVMPEKADIRSGKISIMAPIGTALLGFSEGATVTWQVPSGWKRFLILEVDNQVN